MRKEFLEDCSKEEAMIMCPWATFVCKCEGGYQCFESWADYLLYMYGNFDNVEWTE